MKGPQPRRRQVNITASAITLRWWRAGRATVSFRILAGLLRVKLFFLKDGKRFLSKLCLGVGVWVSHAWQFTVSRHSVYLGKVGVRKVFTDCIRYERSFLEYMLRLLF